MSERRATFTICCARDSEGGMVQAGVFEGTEPQFDKALTINCGWTLEEALTVAIEEAVEGMVATTKRKRPKDYRAADAKASSR